MLERDEGMTIFLIVQNRVSLAERPPRCVLSGQTNAYSFRRKGRQGERFGGGPVERRFTGSHFATGMQSALQLGMHADSSLQVGEFAQQVVKLYEFHPRRDYD